MTKLNCPESHTPEEVAMRLILEAEIRDDEDYIALAKRIDDAVADLAEPIEP
jgi:hypothetical protein